MVTPDPMTLAMAPGTLIGQLDRERTAPLSVMDTYDARFGRGFIVPARAELIEKSNGSTKVEMRNPRYTTQVSELPTAHA